MASRTVMKVWSVGFSRSVQVFLGAQLHTLWWPVGKFCHLLLTLGRCCRHRAWNIIHACCVGRPGRESCLEPLRPMHTTTPLCFVLCACGCQGRPIGPSIHAMPCKVCTVMFCFVLCDVASPWGHHSHDGGGCIYNNSGWSC